jgi:hypothetical protein
MSVSAQYATTQSTSTQCALTATKQINQTVSPLTSDRGNRPNQTKGDKQVNTFTYTESILKGVRDYQSVIKGTVVDRREDVQPDGSTKSKFVSARQVTFTDPVLVEFVRQNFNATSEYKVTINGYETSTFSEKNQKWYDNKIVTDIALV